jgi:phosphomannomutase
MLEAVRKGYKTVVGFEANGGFLTASDIVSAETGQLLAALPTRDAILPIVGVLRRSVLTNQSLSQQVSELPAVFTSSGLIKSFANELGHSLVRRFEAESSALANLFFRDTFGELISIDFTDGARMTFTSGDVVHLRPSGNAPEFRCYTESSSQEAADQNNRTALKIVETVIRPFLEMSI